MTTHDSKQLVQKRDHELQSWTKKKVKCIHLGANDKSLNVNNVILSINEIIVSPQVLCF